MRTAKIAVPALVACLAAMVPAAADIPADSPKQPDPLFEEFVCPAESELVLRDRTRGGGNPYRLMSINEDGRTAKFCNEFRCKNVFAWELFFARCEPYL